MEAMTTQHFPIPHRGPYRLLGSALGARAAAVDVGADEVTVTYGPWFRARFPRSAFVDVAPDTRRTVSRGVHGWRGRWLVNGAGTGLVRITLDPPQRARTTGVSIRLRELTVNVEDPAALVAALRS
jgi:hypothetical protein